MSAELGISPSIAGLVVYYLLGITDDITSVLWLFSDFESKIISFERCLAFVG